MIKVLYIMDWLMARSGITSFAMNYFRKIDQNRVRIDFLLLSDLSDGVLVNEVRMSGSEVYCISLYPARSPWKICSAMEGFFREHAGQYAVVHSHVFQLDFLIFRLAHKYGIKTCISHAHTTKWADYRFRVIRNRIMAIPVPYCADVWGACSIAAGEFLYGKTFARSPKRWVVHNAIEVQRFAFDADSRKRVRREFGYTDEIVLGNVGRLSPPKNQTFLLDIMKTLLENGQTQYRMLIVGDGELREELLAKVERRGVREYVTFAGMRSDIPEMLWAMDIFLFPSLYEGLGIAGIEAQATGLPCIFSEEVPREAMVTEAWYLPINKGAEMWATAIRQMSTLSKRDLQAAKFFEAGYDIATEAEKITRYYENLA